MKEQWKQQMQQKLTEYQRSAPDMPWADIEQRVAAQRKPALAVALWLRRAAAAAAVLLLVGAGWWMTRQPAVHETVSQQAAPAPHAPTKEPLIASSQPPIANRQQPIANRQQPKANRQQPTATQLVSHPVDTNADTVATEEAISQELTANSQEPTANSQPPIANRPTANSQQPIANSQALTASVLASESTVETEERSPALTAYVSTPMSGETGLGHGRGGLVYGDYTTQQPVPSTTDHSVTEHARHHQPIRFGLSLRYPLGERWSIESGLSYTRLSADVTRTEGTKTTAIGQKLHYIGLPVSVSCRLWSTRRFQLYGTGGGMVEKMVSGSRTAYGQRESLTIRPLQFSLNAGAGAEYQLAPSLGLYVEPGVSYHFDNGSSVPTFYQEQPFSFQLNMGIRWSVK